MIPQTTAFKNLLKKRRSCRKFSDTAVSKQVIENCLSVADHAPSGGNKQPWTFVAVSNPKLKSQIRDYCEKIETDFYNKNAPQEWLNSLKKLDTNDHKPFLTEAPWLIIIFMKRFILNENNDQEKVYYPQKSLGIATGFLITALHNAGLSSLTYTPFKMDGLNDILDRPKNEIPFMIIPTGFPHKDWQPPELVKTNNVIFT